MLIRIEHRNKGYVCDLNKAIDISVPMEDHSSLRAFGAPEIVFEPLKEGDFIGSIEAGSPVNFYNIKMNPHGNGTHTETVLHINERGETINKCLKNFHYKALLVTAEVKYQENGDRIIDRKSLKLSESELEDIQALIIRTLPNEKEKKGMDYSGTNPCYIDPELTGQLSRHIEHLLVDLPSVDKEKDGGKLMAHNAFWNTSENISLNKTITEFVYIEDHVKDGLYLLNLQTIPLELDVSPSRPVLYRMEEE